MKISLKLSIFFIGSLFLALACNSNRGITTTSQGQRTNQTEREPSRTWDNQTGTSSTKSEHTIEFTDANFNNIVIDKNGIAVVEFWAVWCGPCKIMGPIIEDLADDYKGKASIGKINVDHNPEVTMQFGIRSIPTVLIFKNGELVEKQVGTTSKAALVSKIEAHL
jgi:thioredoxin 1